MSCKMNIDLIQQYLEDTLSPVEKMLMEEHLRVCEGCRKELAEMKLLFFELEEFKESDIEIPSEVIQIRNKVINEYISTANSHTYSLKDFMNTQKQAFGKAGVFLKFIPGFSSGAKYVEKGIRKTPSLLYRTMEGAFMRSRKLMLMRARA